MKKRVREREVKRVIQKTDEKKKYEREENEEIAAVVKMEFMLHCFSCRDIVRGIACRSLIQPGIFFALF